jgi:hypothetical protein
MRHCRKQSAAPVEGDGSRRRKGRGQEEGEVGGGGGGTRGQQRIIWG